MALNTQVWIKQILEGFYPDDSFLTKTVNYSEFVDNNRMHVASAGIDPKVLINNTTYPVTVAERSDEDNEIILDRFATENTLVRYPETIEYSYDQLESVIRQHRATLRKSVATKAAHAYAPAADSADTPLVMTTGEAAAGRKRLVFSDILTLKERFDDAEIPLADRYIVLHPKHVSDLLLQDIELFKNLTNIKDGEPFRFAGFGFFSFPAMPTYQNTDGVLTKMPFGAVPEDTNVFSSIAFYAKEVMRADGTVKMFLREDDPYERATIVGFEKRFIALPMRGKGIGAIVSTAV